MFKFRISILVYSLLVLALILWVLPTGNVAFFWSVLGVSFVYLVFLFTMSMAIRCNFFLKATHTNANEKIVLTFDDGPHPEYTLKVLDILDDQGIKAVFFMIGKQVETYPEVAREVVLRGHQVGIHTQNHTPYFGVLPAGALRRELTHCSEVIERITGVKPVLFRPPYGITNPILARELPHLGHRVVGWNVRSFDTAAKSGEKLRKRVVKLVSPGSIVLLHDRMPLTCEVLPEIIEEIKGTGFAFGSLEWNK